MTFRRNLVGFGPFSGLPAAGNAGAMYYSTDGYIHYIDNGTEWRPIITDRLGKDPPAANAFTNVQASGLTNTATLAKIGGAIEYTWNGQGSLGAGQPERLCYKSAPSAGATGWRVSAHFRMIGPAQAGGSYSFIVALGFRLASSGSVEFHEWCLKSSGTVNPQRRRYTTSDNGTAPTFTFNSQIIAPTIDSSLIRDIWLRVVRLNTGVRKFYISTDGIHWRKMTGFDTTADEFITPDQIIFSCCCFADNVNDTEVLSGCVIDSWEEESF